MRCAIFQINNNLLKVRKTMTLLQKSPCISLSLQERRVALSQRFFETSTFYHTLTIFNSYEMCWLPTKSTRNNFYSRNLTFLLHDTVVVISFHSGERVQCLKTITDLFILIRKILILLHKRTYIPASFQKKKQQQNTDGLHRKDF